MTGMHLHIGDPSAVGEARRGAIALARAKHFDETDTGRVGLVVTELASNLVKHAGGGEIIIVDAGDAGDAGIDVLALDRGPGIADFREAMRDGYSSAGTPGGGLGAVARLGAVFEVYSRRDAGTVLFARIADRSQAAPTMHCVIGGVNVPHPQETISGDAWTISRRTAGVVVLVADGLGHGPQAHTAACAAAEAFHAHAQASPGELVTRIHEALRPTRGAAVGVAEIAPGQLRFAGLGNIAGTILANGTTRSVISHHGTAGHDVRRIQEFAYPWVANATLVLHSDGLMSRWSLDDYPGLIAKHPVLIAGVLYRDFRRGRDDTTVVVVREAA